jgi:hypothetical protein
MRLIIILFFLFSLSGCCSVNIKDSDFKLGNTSPPPMAQQGHSWNENLSHSEWVNYGTQSSGVLNDPTSGSGR